MNTAARLERIEQAIRRLPVFEPWSTVGVPMSAISRAERLAALSARVAGRLRGKGDVTAAERFEFAADEFAAAAAGDEAGACTVLRRIRERREKL